MKKINQMAGAALVVAVLAVASVPAFGATYTNAQGGTVGVSLNAINKAFVFEDVLEISDYTLASNDVIQLFNVASNWTIAGVSYKVLGTTTNAFQFDVGDGDDADGWLVNVVPTNAAVASGGIGSSIPTITASGVGPTSAVVVTVSVTPAYGLGKQYKVNDTIDLTVDSVPTTTGRLHFAVWGYDTSKH